MSGAVRARAVIWLVVSLATLAACATHVQRLYEGEAAAETATIYNSRRAFVASIVSILSIDDRRIDPKAAGYSFAPGSHRFQVWVERLSKVSFLLLHDVYSIEAVCGFTLDVPPGWLQLEDLEHDAAAHAAEPSVFRAVLRLRGESAGASPVTAVSAECARMDRFEHGRFEIPHDLAKGGLLCRSRPDCLKEGAVCNVADGYTWGICKRP